MVRPKKRIVIVISMIEALIIAAIMTIEIIIFVTYVNIL